MVRMEIACLLVVVMVSIMYFSARREKTRLHKIFSLNLIITMIHIFFDGVTIITVNNMDVVPLWLNDFVHRVFIGTMMLVFCFVYLYIAALIEDDIGERIRISGFNMPFIILAMILTWLLPIEYVQTENGNYSYGPLAYFLYICVATYMIAITMLLCRYWNKIEKRKKTVVTITLATELGVLIIQGIFPLTLVSGIGIMLVTLSCYLLMENPDILLVKQIKKEKQKADDANAAKSTFLSRMSHEIRTPMNAVVGMTEILLRTELTDEQKEYLNNIKASGNALVSIINDILDISKIEAGKMELVEDVYDIHTVLNDVRMIILNRIGDKNIELLYDISENLPHGLVGDALRIRQILINLLNNAVKFTDEGYVKLAIKLVSLSETEAVIRFEVSDTGQGIKEEDLERLFGQFSQVDVKKNIGKEGTGLGLAISNQLVAMMGGKIQVTSQYGKGTQFFFEIHQQVTSADENNMAECDEIIEFKAPDARVLIVDDSEMNCKVAIGLMSPLDMNVDTAENGKVAIEKIKNNHYDLVFMDHMMPVMDGVEATKCIRNMDEAYYKEIPIVALTANAMKEAEQTFRGVGVNDFLAKPIDVRELFKIVIKWLPSHLIMNCESETDKENGVVNVEVCSGICDMEGIDVKEAVKNCGTYELFISLLGDFYRLIDEKSRKIEMCIAEEMFRDFTIEVHAMKNAARMIGATELAEKFYELEKLGNAEALEDIREKTPEVLEMYRHYKTVLKKYGEDEEEKRCAESDELIMYLSIIHDAIEAFDLDKADEAMKALEECCIPKKCHEQMEKLRICMIDVAMEEILNITTEMIKELED